MRGDGLVLQPRGASGVRGSAGREGYAASETPLPSWRSPTLRDGVRSHPIEHYNFDRSEQDQRAQRRTQFREQPATRSWHMCIGKTGDARVIASAQTAAATCAFLLVSAQLPVIFVRCAAASRPAAGPAGAFSKPWNAHRVLPLAAH